ncbi:MAG TPA: hypothetical protein PKM35_06090 [Holophaga sp.]|nr:hypothetical protein [Holophaga sp.]HPS67126.1 hypothetical protein [Holophaga sp.]
MLRLPIRFAGSYSFDGRKTHPTSGITLDEDLIVVGTPATLDIRIDLEAVTGLQPFVRFPSLAWGLRVEHLDATVRSPLFLHLPALLRPSRALAALAARPGLAKARVDLAAWKFLLPR